MMPDLSVPGWAETTRTLHLWSQLLGKTRLELCPMTNHWWQVPLYVTARGLSTSLIPYGARAFDVELDLLAHRLEVRASDGGFSSVALRPSRLADFSSDYFGALAELGIDLEIDPLAVEIAETIHLDSDTQRRAYDAAA